jgi:hypothetical protein
MRYSVRRFARRFVFRWHATQVPNRIRRLVYWNAFVPNNGESLNDMVPPPYVTLFEQKFSGFAVSNLAQGFHQ